MTRAYVTFWTNRKAGQEWQERLYGQDDRMSRSTGMCESDDGQDDLMSRSTGMCESDDGQDDLMSRSTGMCESDQARWGLIPTDA